MNDNDVDPILSLIYTIIKNISAEKNFGKDVNILRVAGEIVGLFTGKNTNGLYEVLQGEDILQKIRGQKNEQDKIAEFLNSLLMERGERLVIFIDELDRCKPLFAVQLLERIKHYFCNDKITFVFATNLSELQHMIKRLYGGGCDASLYLDRFFDLRITMPEVKLGKYYVKIGMDGENNYEEMCRMIIRNFNFELREISKFYNQAKLVGYKKIHDINLSTEWWAPAEAFCITIFVPLILGLKFKDINMYHKFIEGKDIKPLIELVTDEEKVIEYCSVLLNEFETYSNEKASSDKRIKLVKVEDKLNEVYYFLFGKHNKSGSLIGRCSFVRKMRNIIIRTADGFSEDNYYSC